MSTLQDIKAFVQRQDASSQDELEARVAKEFEMSRDEAAQVMRNLESEDPSLDTRSPSLLEVRGAVAAGLAGTMQVGGTQNALGVGALLVGEDSAAQRTDLDNENIPSR